MLKINVKTAFIAVLLGLVALVGCQREDLMPKDASLRVELIPPKGVEPIELDSIWVRVRNVRSGHVDSTLSRVGQPILYTLEVGNYDFYAHGHQVGERTIRLWQAVANSYAVQPKGSPLALQLEESVVQNPDYKGDGQDAELLVAIIPPVEAAFLSLQGLSVRAISSTTGDAKLANLDAKGRARLLLSEGVYRVEVYGSLEDENGGKIELFGAIDDLEMPKQGGISTQITLQRTEPGPEGDGMLSVQLLWPGGKTNYNREGQSVKLRKLPNGQTVEVATDSIGRVEARLPFGTYLVEAEAAGVDDSQVRIQTFRSKPLEVKHLQEGTAVQVPLSVASVVSGLVFKEIYYTCCDRNYQVEHYVELYNNTPYTLYVDGVSFCTTYSNTMLSKSGNFFPEYIGSDRVVPGCIFTIPGNGREHPLAPGKTVLLANQGLNHHAINPLSPVDLSGADFEWYDDDPHDVDVPEVPNLIKYYSFSRTVTPLHSRGYEGFFIMKGDCDMENFLKRYEATGKFPNGSTAHFYAIDQRYILDGVQCAAPQGPQCLVFTPTVDAGWSYCNYAFIAKTVRRKVAGKDGDRYILMDTNNSTVDFIPNAEPSPRVVKE